MPKFTKKPVEVEARQFDGTQGSAKAVCAWMAAYGCEALRAFCGHDEPYQVYISTLEGRMTASAGDWIIRGVKGEFYPCKPDIFAETYEPSALSHAAGQDGEQCRAASVGADDDAIEAAQDAWERAVTGMGLMLPSWHSLGPMRAAFDAYQARSRNRAEQSDADRRVSEKLQLIRALSRGVPEGK